MWENLLISDVWSLQIGNRVLYFSRPSNFSAIRYLMAVNYALEKNNNDYGVGKFSMCTNNYVRRFIGNSQLQKPAFELSEKFDSEWWEKQKTQNLGDKREHWSSESWERCSQFSNRNRDDLLMGHLRIPYIWVLYNGQIKQSQHNILLLIIIIMNMYVNIWEYKEHLLRVRCKSLDSFNSYKQLSEIFVTYC